MDPITSSDIVGEEFGEKFLSSLSLSAGAVAQKLNDVACYVDSTFAQLSDSGIETLVVTGNCSLSGGASLGLLDSSDQVKSFNIKGGYLEGSCGKYTKAKGKMGREDSSTASKYYYEPMCVGAKCYCVLSAWNDEELNDGKGMLKLSGDISGLEELLALPDSKDCRWSLGLYNMNNPGTYAVIGTHDAGDGVKLVKLGQTLDLQYAGIIDAAGNFINGFDRGEERYLEIWENGLTDEDDNCFYCPTWPEAGNQVSPFMKYAHAEGVASRAVQRFDHAEGRKNIVDGKYSHVEGDENIAYGWNNHTEGYSNRVHNATGNHVEGSQHVVNAGLASHIEGQYNTVEDSDARIIKTQGTHIEGALQHVSNTKFSHIGGVSHTVKGGENVTVGGEYHVVTDVRNVTVYGRSNNVSDCPNGYGRGNVNGLGLSVSGCDNSFDVIGSYLTVLSSNYSEVHGTCVSIAKQNACFVWSGKTVSKEEDKYGYAEGEDGSRIAKFPNGSFCINPNNGINQVFIGDKSLSTIIKEAIDQGLKDAMS